MKYYFLLPDLSAGGAERVSITIARLLKKNGYDIAFLNLGQPKGEMVSWISPEFELVSLGCKRVLSALPKLKRFMQEHDNTAYFSSREHVNLVGLIAARMAHKQIIVRVPNMPYNNLVGGISGLKERIIKVFNKNLFPSAQYVIAQNKEMRRQLLKYYSLNEEKVVVINNPIDEDYVRRSAENCVNPFPGQSTIFLAACTIDYRKGIDILMKAWPIVKNEIPNGHMFIIGRDTSDYAQKLKTEAKCLNNFTFLGFQGNPYPYLKYCNVFVLSSRMEGFPNVVLEAMCFNKPVASTTCVDVIKDIIQPGKNGYYCDIEAPEALAQIIINASKLQNIDNNYNLFSMNELLGLFRK